MSKKASIKVSGLHTSEAYDEDENIEVISIGTYSKRNGIHFIKYDEQAKNPENVNHNLIKIAPQQIEIVTRGAGYTDVIFRIGEKITTYYATPFGGMNISIDTYDMNFTEEDDRISVDINYGLEVNLDYVAECKVHIEIEMLEDR